MKDLGEIEQRLETRLGILAVPCLGAAVWFQNWWYVIAFLLLAMGLEYAAGRGSSPVRRDPS